MGPTAYLARLTPHAQRDLLGVPRPDALRILQRLTEFQTALTAGDTTAFDTRALHGHPARRWLRLHVGDYQAVYTIEDGRLLVWVLASEHHRSGGR
ncbi:type II toxin-antitoxin system RelE/ParE family toxin [Streptomyces sp. NPDC056773]|uniref:type II toxin-antitoxin system RelE family toxin n=1 Tax=unclassified Streptomyces TaxID=2593676 RepID=UPI0036D1DED9